ncbi:MAG: CoA transferase [Proteobacteria bacterium]|nr:CoA transferase [Pseudomonadota bacterium]
MPGPLDGLLAISLEQAVAAPYLSCKLADAGARVIKIERQEGDFARSYDTVVHGESAYFVWLNRGKESVQLDIKDADDLALLKRMIQKADIFIQNLSPGAAARYGLSDEELRTTNAGLITVDISGYGEEGPYAQMKAYDMLVQSETGLASITGTPDSPGRVGVSVCDIAAGMHGLVGVLEALYERERTGLGRSVKSTLFAGMADWMSVPLLHYEYGGKAPSRVGLSHPSIAPYEAYETKDGSPIVISIQNQNEWRSLCKHALKQEELANDPRFETNEKRVTNRTELNDELNAVFGAHNREEMTERLRAGRIAYGSLNSVADLSQHPQLERCEVETPNGTANMIASPIHIEGEKPDYLPVPALGQHNEKIRDEFKD